MDVTYEALENANLSLQDVWGTQTTCYIGPRSATTGTLSSEILRRT